MTIAKAVGFDANVLINDAVGAPGAPGAYFGYERSGSSVNSTGPRQYALNASPNGVLTAPAGSTAQVTDGTLWVNTNGATNWVRTANTVVWNQVYAIDFTAQPSQDYQVTPTQTLTPSVGSAALWTSMNAGAGTFCQMINGTGLKIGVGAASGLAWNNAAATAPALTAVMSALIGAYAVSDLLCFQYYYDTASFPAVGAYDAWATGVYEVSAIPGALERYYQGVSAGTSLRVRALNKDSGGSGFLLSTTPGAYVDVSGFILQGLFGKAQIASWGAWGGSFPRPPTGVTVEQEGSSGIAPLGTNPYNTATDKHVFTVIPGGGNPAFAMIWKGFSIWKAAYTLV